MRTPSCFRIYGDPADTSIFYPSFGGAVNAFSGSSPFSINSKYVLNDGDTEFLSCSHFAYIDSMNSTLAVDKKLFLNFESSEKVFDLNPVSRFVVEMIFFITKNI
jgi:hypothetical protein